MSYLEIDDVQAWLQSTKYPVTNVNETVADLVVGSTLGALSQRFDITTWTNGTSTPALIVSAISMKYAAAHLRMVAGEEDGRTTYADWLEQRADQLVKDIIDGCIDIPGVTASTTSDLGEGPLFWPTDMSTALWWDDPLQPGTTPQVFGMDRVY